MKIKVAAAAPEMLPGQPGRNMGNVFAAISRARDDGAAILVLPAGTPENMNPGAIQRQAGQMTVYPLMKPSLTREELMEKHVGKDILCCSSDSPATASSHFETDALAAQTSYDNSAVVVMACPLGGDGGVLYTGRCVIAQNGTLLESADGYVSATVTTPRRDTKPPAANELASQPRSPWIPDPDMLPRLLRIQADGLARRMMALGVTQLSVKTGRDASSLLALAACAAAVDRLKLSRKNIHAQLTGNRAHQIAAALGVTAGGRGALIVDTADLTSRAMEGAEPTHYAVNATIPRHVAQLAIRYYANTCGNMNVSVPIRSIVRDDETPWELYDFLLHFSLVYNLPKWGQARLLEDTFRDSYKSETISDTLDRFFDGYRRPTPCDGPIVFNTDARSTA